MPETTLTWLGHASLPLRHARREARLHRPLPAREPEVPRVRARARADRRDRAHARPRRPCRRHRRPREEARLHRHRAGRAGRLAAGQAGARERPRPEQGRHRRGRRRQVHAHERAPLELEQRPRVHGRARAASSSTIENGTKLYFAGDTCVFGDMQLHPAALRAGRRDPADRRPLHHGSRRRPRSHSSSSARSAASPATTARSRRSRGRRPSCASSRRDVQIDELEPGRLGHAMRERWCGGSGRRVPELAVEGDPECRSTRRSSSTASTTWRRSARGIRRRDARSSCAPPRPRRCRRRSRVPRWPACSCPTDGATCSSSTSPS